MFQDVYLISSLTSNSSFFFFLQNSKIRLCQPAFSSIQLLPKFFLHYHRSTAISHHRPASFTNHLPLPSSSKDQHVGPSHCQSIDGHCGHIPRRRPSGKNAGHQPLRDFDVRGQQLPPQFDRLPTKGRRIRIPNLPCGCAARSSATHQLRRNHNGPISYRVDYSASSPRNLSLFPGMLDHRRRNSCLWHPPPQSNDILRENRRQEDGKGRVIDGVGVVSQPGNRTSTRALELDEEPGRPRREGREAGKSQKPLIAI